MDPVYELSIGVLIRLVQQWEHKAYKRKVSHVNMMTSLLFPRVRMVKLLLEMGFAIDTEEHRRESVVCNEHFKIRSREAMTIRYKHIPTRTKQLIF